MRQIWILAAILPSLSGFQSPRRATSHAPDVDSFHSYSNFVTWHNGLPSDWEESRAQDSNIRRMFFASNLLSLGALLEVANADADVESLGVRPTTSLPWVKDPINPKRTGVRLQDAERLGYNDEFVTYLARFLFNFDPLAQQWWIDGAKEIPPNASSDEVFSIRKEQFGQFAASVELGLLQEFGGPDGPKRLLESLLKRFSSVEEGSSNDETTAQQKQRIGRETKEARRQLALLFSLISSSSQPTEDITKLLAAVDNGSIVSVSLSSAEELSSTARSILRGYAPGEIPSVILPPPQAGLQEFQQATAEAIMQSTGQLLSIDINGNGDLEFKETPSISISPPSDANGEVATATAKLVKGRLSSVELTNPGSGYTKDDTIQILINGKESQNPRLKATAEMAVVDIKVKDSGSGYAVEKPLKVTLKSPTTSAVEVVAVGYPKGELSSFTAYRIAGDNKVKTFEKEVAGNKQAISASSSGGNLPPLPFSSKASSSQQLLSLLPQGFGVEYDKGKKRYSLTTDQTFQEKYPFFEAQTRSASGRLVPDFGPRGESPIERDMNLDLATFLRFCLSGAICSSGVHLALTPLDVVKTKVQTNPEKYPKIGSSFSTVWRDEGPGVFFTGWIPTLSGNFISGAVLYAMTELIRRSLTVSAGSNAESLEVFIILAAAGISSATASIFYCPFEAVRIRSVAQPEFASNSFEVLSRMVQEEGIGSLVNAIPVFLVKQVPYACVKFTIFDLSTEYLYREYPAAQEDLKLSLLISLVGGVLGGVAAAAVSNPADTVISELKKAKSDQTPQEALQALLDRAGFSALFKGLPLRMVFYSLTASLQFMVFDGVRFALGIGPDDLRLYLDVLGGALGERGTIA